MNFWMSYIGIWFLNVGWVIQIDELLVNINFFLLIGFVNVFFVEWEGLVVGMGINWRGGFYYMCDDLSFFNCGNFYFVWFRVDGDVIQFYEVINDVFFVVVSWLYQIDLVIMYNCKVSYDFVIGNYFFWVNDNYFGNWMDVLFLIVL